MRNIFKKKKKYIYIYIYSYIYYYNVYLDRLLSKLINIKIIFLFHRLSQYIYIKFNNEWMTQININFSRNKHFYKKFKFFIDNCLTATNEGNKILHGAKFIILLSFFIYSLKN